MAALGLSVVVALKVGYVVHNAKVVSAQCGLPFFDLTQFDAANIDYRLLSAELICRYKVIPIKQDQYGLHLGMTDPTDYTTIATIGFHTGLPIRPWLVAAEELEKLITTHCQAALLDSQLTSTLSKISPLEEYVSEIKNEENDEEPIIQFLDQLLQEAMQKKISDIHLEPFQEYSRVRFRRDGLLYQAMELPSHVGLRITTRLKMMAKLDIAERRLPQDGRLQLHYNLKRKIDIRINTCPTLFGEKIVLRLLDYSHTTLAIDALGMEENQKNIFLTKLNQPQGLILVTGPTGSGKTITLYSALHYLNHIEKNISSVEDPVEIELTGINQVTINPKIGLDFATVLRTFLRQDPDILMVGEIRDQETATIALQAAQTGHLVLSTLHTNSAMQCLTRLTAMGITDYHIKSALSLIIAQRLVRKLCQYCKAKHSTIGCDYCHQGYQGRTGIFELMQLDTGLIQPSLAEAGKLKVVAGLTNRHEIERIIGDAG